MSDLRLRNLLWSASLITGGLVLLVFNLGVFDAYAPYPQLALAAGCGLAALASFGGFARRRQEWWRLLPAWTLVALGAMVLTSALPTADRALLAAELFLGLALAFGHIYLLERRERWWAVLPGGYMAVLAVVVGFSQWFASKEVLGAALFCGLGLVFFLLYALDRRHWWSLVPGAVLLVLGVLALTTAGGQDDPLARWWPLALIAAGIIVGLGALRKPAVQERIEINTAPKVAPRRAAAPGARPGAAAVSAGEPVPSVLGEYSQPAPGTTIEVWPDADED